MARIKVGARVNEDCRSAGRCEIGGECEIEQWVSRVSYVDLLQMRDESRRGRERSVGHDGEVMGADTHIYR